MRLNITVEGKTYEVDVEVAEEPSGGPVRYVTTGSGSGAAAPTPAARPAAPAPTGGAGREPADEGRACRSPLAGVVSEVAIKPGDEVSADQPVLVLEAMKMFTTITSPVSGKVKAVDVAVGDAVKQGQLLVEFE